MSASEPVVRDLGDLPATRADGPAALDPEAQGPPRAPRGRGLGAASMLCAIGMVLVTTGGSLIAGTGVGALALPLAILALALSLAAIVLGLLALRHRAARTPGALGVALGILLNPALLALLLPAGTA